mmetsp:Transcript_31572/g.94112  ORF Transcript_31572/g.94112 Transcript_31572/m.94112 type:complete len:280 (+) Transcript_31572:2496-3335(+)
MQSSSACSRSSYWTRQSGPAACESSSAHASGASSTTVMRQKRRQRRRRTGRHCMLAEAGSPTCWRSPRAFCSAGRAVAPTPPSAARLLMVVTCTTRTAARPSGSPASVDGTALWPPTPSTLSSRCRLQPTRWRKTRQATARTAQSSQPSARQPPASRRRPSKAHRVSAAAASHPLPPLAPAASRTCLDECPQCCAAVWPVAPPRLRARHPAASCLVHCLRGSACAWALRRATWPRAWCLPRVLRLHERKLFQTPPPVGRSSCARALTSVCRTSGQSWAP